MIQFQAHGWHSVGGRRPHGVPAVGLRSTYMRTLSMRLLALLIVCGVATAASAGDKDWAPLFNGKNLDGWDTWLGNPDGEKKPVGLNKDPKKVYTVVQVDGKPAIRISGELFGALTSKHQYEHSHLKRECKWSEQKWPPRLKAVR